MDQAGTRTPRVFSVRAFVAGSLCSGFLAFACPYTVFLHQAAGMDADFITAGALLLFAVLAGGVNSLLRWVRRSWSLEAGELVVLYTMMVVASAIPTWGLIANLLPVLPGVYYYATPENNWDELIRPHIRSWLVPQDGLAVKHFFEGAPVGTSIPWDAWAGPLTAWLVLILAVYAVMVSMMIIIRRQWVEHERLVFPLTQLPLEMLRQGSPGELVRPFFANPLVWIGFAIPFVIFTTHGLHSYFGYIPRVTIQSDLYLFRASTLVRVFLSFPVIGFTYLINLDVSFSLWVFHLLARLQTGLFNLVGYEVPGQNEMFTGASNGSSPAVSHQAMGAMVVLSLFCLWNAQRHLCDVYGKVFGRASQLDDRQEALPYRVAVWVMLLGLAVITLWLSASGLPLWITPFFIFCAFAIFFGLARIVAEGGVGFCRAQMVAPVFTVYGLGTGAVGPGGLVSLGFTYTWAVDIRTSVMASSINSLKLADAVGICRIRPLLLAIGLAVVISLITAGCTTLWLAYTYGGINLQGWFFNGMPNTVFGFVADKLNNPLDSKVIGPRWAFTGIGAVAMALLMYARQHFTSWPLHYLGLPIADTWVMSWVWFSIFLGWLLKLVVLKYGGIRAYRAGRPLFMGMILGQISCAGMWMIIDAVTGMVGNYIQIGVP